MAKKWRFLLCSLTLLLGIHLTGLAVAAEKVLTFDSLPNSGKFASYTEDGLTFFARDLNAFTPGVSNVFLTLLNSQNSTTAAEIVSTNTRSYTLWMGGRLFSLKSMNLLAPVVGTAFVTGPFGTKTLSPGTTGTVLFTNMPPRPNFPGATFEKVTHIQITLNISSRMRFDDIKVEPVEAPNFVNWETSPIHPVALSPDGNHLAVCNLPDNRLELFAVTNGMPAPIGNVPVGLDPVSVRWRTSNEIWVANNISDSVSVIDLAARRVVATLDTLDTPVDVIFAGTPQRAFISCSMPNMVQVFDPITRSLVTNVSIDGERPKAMATSPDGSKVYVAIFESGNASTILGAAIANGLGSNVVNHPSGPYGGQNPPPNSGAGFSPAINPAIPGNLPPPKVAHIVKKNAAGRWMDDNNADWTEFVSGANASFSGRKVGWDMPDRDLAIIDASTFAVSYATGLMNICMDVAVNPASGQIAVVGTEAKNEMRFEPNLNGVFLRVQLGLVNPSTLARTIKDVNPHLDYITRTLPAAERARSIGDPRGLIWNSTGTRGYITGMGSSNLVVIDANGDRVGSQPILLGGGPTGMALDELRQRLYVLNRFSATISVVDTLSQIVVGTVPLFDPTPEVIKVGRKHLYDTHKTSGLGHVACASCHVDARMDRLAWDLGDPAGPALTNAFLVQPTGQTGSFITNVARFHPMKGPMVTITFQDMIGHEPFHWRADRKNLEEFMPTFTNLQSAATGVTSNEIKEFKDFLSTIHFPPNPFREFDNTLSTNLPLVAHRSIGRGALPAGAQLPNGNAFSGMTNVARPQTGGCMECHSFPSGLFVHGVDFGRLGGISLKPAQLRNLYEKTGLDFDSTSSRAGFGFTHNGNGDTLTRFLQQAFTFVTGQDQQTADFIAFLMSFSGSDLPMGTAVIQSPVGLTSKDAPAAVGKQITVNNAGPFLRLNQMLALANSPTGRVDLLVRGEKDGLHRGWLYMPALGQFQSDRNAESLSASALLNLASAGNELTFTIVPEGSGRRIALDRDMDGFFDRDELDFPSDPANAASIPVNTTATISLSSNLVTISWNSISGKTYQVQFNDNLSLSTWTNLHSGILAASPQRIPATTP
jgi:YVTN family beta-propeller protein